MDIIQRSHLAGRNLQRVKDFLKRQELDWDEHIQSTVCLEENGEIIATGSRHENVLKCIAVSPEREGEGLTATLVTELVKDAMASGHPHLFVFTKPANQKKFEGLAFYPISATEDVVLLENRRDGIKKFVAAFETEPCNGPVGAVVANCNPFTNGHRHLIETAAAQCGLLHLFILSADRSRFSAQVRLQLARNATSDLGNVIVHPTSDYLISSATFPDYFIKDKAKAKRVNCALDLTIFAEHFAAPLGITRRYVGSEPNCAVTNSYNRQMREILPRFGVDVVEIPRYGLGGAVVSASKVRKYLEEGELDKIRPLVPPTTFDYLKTL